jgi:hypothetical protein
MNIRRRNAGRLRGRHMLAVAVAVLGAAAAPASALAYWDYQGNLPMSSGQRYYVKYTNGSTSQDVRMSWTTGSHCMRFLRIRADGGWESSDACGSDPWCIGYYDCTITWFVGSIYDRYGCYNPPDLSTVWVNCRATNPL